MLPNYGNRPPSMKIRALLRMKLSKNHNLLDHQFQSMMQRSSWSSKKMKHMWVFFRLEWSISWLKRWRQLKLTEKDWCRFEALNQGRLLLLKCDLSRSYYSVLLTGCSFCLRQPLNMCQSLELLLLHGGLFTKEEAFTLPNRPLQVRISANAA